eukprot:sb/3473369/
MIFNELSVSGTTPYTTPGMSQSGRARQDQQRKNDERDLRARDTPGPYTPKPSRVYLRTIPKSHLENPHLDVLDSLSDAPIPSPLPDLNSSLTEQSLRPLPSLALKTYWKIYIYICSQKASFPSSDPKFIPLHIPLHKSGANCAGATPKFVWL